MEEKQETKDNYFVLYHRDLNMEKEKKYGQRMLFDYCKYFRRYNEARGFAFRNTPAVFAKRSSLEELTEEERTKVRDSKKPYVVAAQHCGKYKHYSYDGSSDAITTYDAMHSEQNELETKIEEFAKEDDERTRNLQKIIVGVELRYL